MDSGFKDMANMQEIGRENHSSTHTHTHIYTQRPAKSNLQESWAGILKFTSSQSVSAKQNQLYVQAGHTLSATEVGVTT